MTGRKREKGEKFESTERGTGGQEIERNKYGKTQRK
jgi:hypothetical protein